MVAKAKDKISDLIKEGSKNVKEPLSKVEKAIEKARDQLSKNVEKMDTKDIKKVFDDLLGRVRTAQGDLEKFFTTSVGKTYAALNLPTRDDVDIIKKDLNKLTKTVNQLKGGAKKTAKKKVAKKKAPKKTAKKAGKKK